MPDAPRDDLAELLRRRALTEDAARPDAVERRHAGGRPDGARERRGPRRPGLVRRVRPLRDRRAAPAARRSRTSIARTPGRRPGRRHARDGATAQRLRRARPTTTPCSPARRARSGTARRTGCSSSSSGCGCRPCSSPRAAAGARATPTSRSSRRSTRARSRCGRPLGAGAAHRGRQRPLLRGQRGDRRLLGPHRRDRGRVDRHGRPGDDRGRRARARSSPTTVGPIDDAGAATASSTSLVADEAEAVAVAEAAARATSRARPRRAGRRPGPPARPRARARAARLRGRARSSRRSPTRARSTFLRERFAPEMVTALARIEGRPVGRDRQQHDATWRARSRATRPTRRRASCSSATRSACRSCRSSTRPGCMVGPEGRGDRRSSATPRGCSSPARRCACRWSRWSCAAATASARRRWSAGSLHEPLLTVAWPSAHLGPMGLEGAVRLGLRKELEAIEDEAERERARARAHRRRAGERQGAQRRASSSSSTT